MATTAIDVDPDGGMPKIFARSRSRPSRDSPRSQAVGPASRISATITTVAARAGESRRSKETASERQQAQQNRSGSGARVRRHLDDDGRFARLESVDAAPVQGNAEAGKIGGTV